MGLTRLRIKPGQDRKVHHKEFWWFEIHRAYRIGWGKKVKINLVGLCGTDSRKNRPVLQESSGQTSPKSNQLKMDDFVGIFRANFPRNQSALR